MFRPFRGPAIALTLFAVCLAATVAVNAQTKTKPPAKPKAPAAEKPAPEKSEAAEKAAEGYKTVCQACHLEDGKGLTPDMSFNDGVWKHGTTTEAMAKVIAEGVPGTVMLAYKDRFSKEEILELVKIVRSFDPKLKGKK